MNKVKIITDSCSDLPAELREKYDIDYARMNIVVNGREQPASLDWDLYSPRELYDIMRNGDRISTTQVPSVEFARIFTQYLDSGMDIVYIACSSALSGSVNTATVTKNQLKEKYPSSEIYCVDSKNACMGEGIMAIKAATLAAQGKSAAEIAAYIDEIKLTINQFCTVQSLDYMKRAGRIKASAAFFGNLFGVKPIIISDSKGQNAAVKKVKGRNASIDEIVNMLGEVIINPEEQTIYIGHADCQEDIEYMCRKIREKIKCRDVYTFYIGPIIGATTGPATLVAYCEGKAVEIAL